MLQIVASLIDAARGVINDRHMFIVQATEREGLLMASGNCHQFLQQSSVECTGCNQLFIAWVDFVVILQSSCQNI